MEIETGINPNCSELVVRLPPWDNDAEVRDMLRRLEEATGWNAGCAERYVKTDEGTFHVAAPVPTEKVRMGDVLSETHLHVQLGDIPAFEESKETSEQVGKRLKYGVSDLRRLLAEGFWCGSQEKPIPQRKEVVGLIPHDEIVVSDTANSSSSRWDELMRVDSSDGYDDHPAMMASQHCYTPHFEPLAKVVRSLGYSWHTHDGGSPDKFEQWCRKNGYEDVADKNRATGFI